MKRAKPDQNDRDGRPNGSQPIRRADLETVFRALQERDELLDQLRRELRETCLHLGEDVRRELQTQFTRIAQLQQEIDALKRRA